LKKNETVFKKVDDFLKIIKLLVDEPKIKYISGKNI